MCQKLRLFSQYLLSEVIQMRDTFRRFRVMIEFALQNLPNLISDEKCVLYIYQMTFY
jgi:hypothetical protein